MVQRVGVGVAALGMGGAFTAVADDYTALSHNPAGLALIRRFELAGSFEHRTVTNEIVYLGKSEDSPFSKSRIHSLGFAYPYPTWRGSFVIAASYNRVATFDQEYFRAGLGRQVDFEEESILEEGSLGAWQAGFGVDVSPRLSLGATATLLSGSSRRERRFEFEHANGVDWELTETVADLDLLAVTGTLGALLRVQSGWRFGLAIHLPEAFDLDGRSIEDVRRYQASGDTLDYYDDYSFEDEITLPFRTSVGVSWSPPRSSLQGLLLSAQWDYADWQQIDYAGPIRLDDREFAYRATHDLRVGAQYASPRWPLKLRAGFFTQPVAYRAIATDVFLGEAVEADFEQDRRYVTLGAAVQLDPNLAVDVAFLNGTFRRSGRSAITGGTTVEEITDRRVLLSAAFRF